MHVGLAKWGGHALLGKEDSSRIIFLDCVYDWPTELGHESCRANQSRAAGTWRDCRLSLLAPLGEIAIWVQLCAQSSRVHALARAAKDGRRKKMLVVQLISVACRSRRAEAPPILDTNRCRFIIFMQQQWLQGAVA